MDQKRMDVYSIMRVPFAVAAFCRGRRHLREAVALAVAIRASEAAVARRDEAIAALDLRESEVTAAEADIDKAVQAVLDKSKELGA